MNSKLLAEAKQSVSFKNGYQSWAEVDAQTKSGLVDEVAVEYEQLLRIGKGVKQRRDYFAGLSLQAMITKMPMLDQNGELGVAKSEQETQDIKKDLALSAWAYADWMIYTEDLKP